MEEDSQRGPKATGTRGGKAMAQPTDQSLTQGAREHTQDSNSAPVPGDPLRGGTQGGEAARVLGGTSVSEGTRGISNPSGSIHVPTPDQHPLGVDVGPDQPFLARGRKPNDIRRWLEGAEFPTKKDRLVHLASQNAAPNDVVLALTMLGQTDYGSFDEVIRDYPRLPDREDFTDKNNVGPGAKKE